MLDLEDVRVDQEVRDIVGHRRRGVGRNLDPGPQHEVDGALVYAAVDLYLVRPGGRGVKPELALDRESEVG
jgi:hypothetical protein